VAKRFDGPCGDPYCYRGAYGNGGPGGAMTFKDGPCNSPICQWPADKPTRPHYTDNPTKPIVDAGAKARDELAAQEVAAACSCRNKQE